MTWNEETKKAWATDFSEWHRQQIAWVPHDAARRAQEHAEAVRVAARLARERQEAETRQQAAEALELAAARRAAELGSVDAMRRICESIERTHRITNETRSVMPLGVAAFAEWRQRHIVTPPITSETAFAIRLHEVGHILAGECTNREPHRRNPEVMDWSHCVECERAAWAQALKLVPFSRAMFERLKASLTTYHRRTPAAVGVVAAVRRLSSDTTYAEMVNKRLAQQVRCDQIEEIRQIAEDAQRPRVLRRWERQWQEIQHAAKEAAHDGRSIV